MEVKVMEDNNLQISPLDEADFRVASRDTNGHQEIVHYRTQPSIVAQISKLVMSHRFPFRSPSEFHRLADILLLKVLDAMYPGIPSVLATVDAINSIIQEDEYYQDFVSIFEKLNKRVVEHIGRGATGEAVRLIVRVKDKLKTMPEGYWKDHYLREISSRWDGLVTSQGTVNLSKEFVDI